MNPADLLAAALGAVATGFGILLATGRLPWLGAYGLRFALLLFGPSVLLFGAQRLLDSAGAPSLVVELLKTISGLLFVAGLVSAWVLRGRAALAARRSEQPASLPTVHLEPWDESGMQLLRDCNSAEMTAYLGGPETEEKLLDRQRRYLTYTGGGSWAFRVVYDGDNVGSVNYWEDDDNYEMGWAIAPLFQGLGFAKEAVALALAHAATTATRSTVHALPSIDNAASNGVARSAGFVSLGQRRIEYPVGHFMMANDWVHYLAKR